jgi:glycosyltransferase involved in cell wall biosynthesis
MVATAQQRRDLELHGFGRLAAWGRGVDTDLFCPGDRTLISGPRPVWIYAGRVAVEKSLDDFLALDLPGTKYVVGDGPARAPLETRFPEARFTGYRFGKALAELMGAADVFVFPSRTDTYGIVMLEAMACGLPVAAYPVTGPVDVVEHGVTGILSHDLRDAALRALGLDRARCREAALGHSWLRATQQFTANLVPVRGPEPVSRAA